MRLLNEYEQELIIMLLASERDMQKTLLSVLSQKMFLNRTFAKVFEICEHLMNSNKEVNVFTVTVDVKNCSTKTLVIPEENVNFVNIPEGFEVIELPASTYLLFRGEPFAEENYEYKDGKIILKGCF